MGTKVKTKRYARSSWQLGYQGFADQEPNATASVSVTELSCQRTTGENIPGWQLRIAQGLDATTSLTGTDFVFTSSSADVESSDFFYGLSGSPPVSKRWNQHYHRYGDFVPIPASTSLDPSSVSIEEARNKALMRFITKCRAKQTAVLGGAFIKELSETIHMIRHPAQALRHGLDDYIGKLTKYRRRLPNRHKRKVLANSWLEWQFGWQPTIKDITDAAVRLQTLPKAELEKVVAIEEVASPETFSRTFSQIGRVNWENYTRRGGHAKVIYRGAVKHQVEHPVNMSARALGFSWSDFVPTVWEVIPYSFLIDYFTNIGDVLSAWSYPMSNISWWNTTFRQSDAYRVVMCNFVITPLFDGISCDSLKTKPGSASGERSIVARASGSGGLIPSFRFQLPGAGSLRWLNIASLVQTRRKFNPY